MGLFTVFVILASAVVVDFFWFDVERKRLGWMKSWSKRNKLLFFSGFLLVFFFIYLGLSFEYIYIWNNFP